ncbi:hypothetical protein E2C01_093777 [Portunus trituberculatus]|uniref:Uncharacterized protein n=1 Tax=Portunus trituberculatus TaxID=210409 RepID=A0A5B7JZ22_PORTR|nr:hypothetical protein [Portunus trituberculatus]
MKVSGKQETSQPARKQGSRHEQRSESWHERSMKSKTKLCKGQDASLSPRDVPEKSWMAHRDEWQEQAMKRIDV